MRSKIWAALPALVLLAALALPAFADTLGIAAGIINSTFLPGENKPYLQLNITSANNTTTATFSSTLPFDTFFSENPTGNITNETYAVTVNVSVPSGTQAGNYSGNISVTSAFGTQKVGANITVLGTYLWSVDPDTVTKTVTNGESGTIKFTASSTSNDDIELVISASGNATDFLSFPETATVLPSVPKNISVGYTIPSSAAEGHYESLVLFNHTSGYDKAVVELNVGDTIPPTVTTIQADDAQSTLPTKIQVIATDNQNVSQAWASVTHTYIYNTTVSNESGNFIIGHRDNSTQRLQLPRVEATNNYSAQFANTTQISEYYITIEVNDTSGNVQTNRTSFHVSELDAVRAAAELKFPKVKKDNWASLPFFNLSVSTPTRIILNINYGGGWSAQLIGPTSTLPMDRDITSVEVSDIGSYALKIKGDQLGEFYGYAQISGIPTAKRLPNVSITGEFVNYTMPNDFVTTFADTEMTCTGVDTGEFSSSYYECRIKYPPGVTRDELTVMMSSTSINELKEGYEAKINAERAAASFGWSMFYLMIFVGAMYAAYKFVDDNLVWMV